MVIPEHISFTNWAHSLLIDFPHEDINVYAEGTDWKEWGDMLAQCDIFTSAGAPGTEKYADWQSWAKAVFYCMANY